MAGAWSSGFSLGWGPLGDIIEFDVFINQMSDFDLQINQSSSFDVQIQQDKEIDVEG